jgi:hypothetical protein
VPKYNIPTDFCNKFILRRREAFGILEEEQKTKRKGGVI